MGLPVVTFEQLVRDHEKALNAYQEAKERKKEARLALEEGKEKDAQKGVIALLELQYKRERFRKKMGKIDLQIAERRLKVFQRDGNLDRLYEIGEEDEADQKDEALYTADGKRKRKRVAPSKAVVVETIEGGDDFSQIEGVGKKAAFVLKKNGVMTFADLANQNPDELKSTIFKGREFNLVRPNENWARQAELARDGKWDELAALKATLKGGK